MSSIWNPVKKLRRIRLGVVIATGLAPTLYVGSLASMELSVVALILAIVFLVASSSSCGRRLQAISLGRRILRATTSARVPTEAFLSALGISDPAINQFVEGTRLESTQRRYAGWFIRHLLYQEGRIVDRRPCWAASESTADLCLQVGDWLFLTAERGANGGGFIFGAVEVQDPPCTWDLAVAYGWIRTLPPLIMKETEGGPSLHWVPEIMSAARVRARADRKDYAARLRVDSDGLERYFEGLQEAREAHQLEFGRRRAYGLPSVVPRAVKWVYVMLAIVLLANLL